MMKIRFLGYRNSRDDALPCHRVSRSAREARSGCTTKNLLWLEPIAKGAFFRKEVARGGRGNHEQRDLNFGVPPPDPAFSGAPRRLESAIPDAIRCDFSHRSPGNPCHGSRSAVAPRCRE